MKVVRTREALARAVAEQRARGDLALVPTMGFLHEGHLSLVDLAHREATSVAVSIFVNPLQFGPDEDLEVYPRDEARDLALLEARGTGLVFIPSVQEMYPDGEPVVTVDPGPMARVLCGAFRPGHFRGVLTVVARLFGLFRPDVAVFGRKDFQQSVLIRRMVQDLELGVRVLTGPVIREEDGLAMSSRNSYLEPGERASAPELHRALEEARKRHRQGERSASALKEAVRQRLDGVAHLRLQYVEVVEPDGLEPVEVAEPETVVAAAALLGDTRLIDNVTLR